MRQAGGGEGGEGQVEPAEQALREGGWEEHSRGKEWHHRVPRWAAQPFKSRGWGAQRGGEAVLPCDRSAGSWPSQPCKVRACVYTGRGNCEPTFNCHSLSVAFLLSCRYSTSASGPWAPRPPPRWPVTPPPGAQHPPAACHRLLLGAGRVSALAGLGGFTKAPFTRGHRRGTGRGCGALLPVGIKTLFLFCCTSLSTGGRRGQCGEILVLPF